MLFLAISYSALQWVIITFIFITNLDKKKPVFFTCVGHFLRKCTQFSLWKEFKKNLEFWKEFLRALHVLREFKISKTNWFLQSLFGFTLILGSIKIKGRLSHLWVGKKDDTKSKTKTSDQFLPKTILKCVKNDNYGQDEKIQKWWIYRVLNGNPAFWSGSQITQKLTDFSKVGLIFRQNMCILVFNHFFNFWPFFVINIDQFHFY